MKIKRTWVAALFAVGVLSFAVVLAGCNGADKKKAGSSDDKKSSFTVGFDQDFPPYGYVDESGNFAGFDLDLAAEVAKRNDWEIVYRPINWDAKDMELGSGAIDCIWNGFTIEGRKDGYEWTSPYMDNSQVMVVKKDSNISSLADLKDKTVMTQADSAALNLLSKKGEQEKLADTLKKLLTTPEYNTAFMELESGSVDAVAIDLPVAKFQTQGKDNYAILEQPLSTEHYGVGFLKGNTELRDTVQKTLIEMYNDGFVEKVANKYADQGISYDSYTLK